GSKPLRLSIFQALADSFPLYPWGRGDGGEGFKLSPTPASRAGKIRWRLPCVRGSLYPPQWLKAAKAYPAFADFRCLFLQAALYPAGLASSAKPKTRPKAPKR